MGMEGLERARRNLEAFHVAIEAPVSAQESLLQLLVSDYTKTEYGEGKHATTIEEYREQYPTVNYHYLEPWFERVRKEKNCQLVLIIETGVHLKGIVGACRI